MTSSAGKRFYVFRKLLLRGLFRLVDGAGDWAARRRKAGPLPESLERILLIRLDHLGDLILSLPAIEAVRKKFPRARLDLLASPKAREIVPKEWVDRIIPASAPWFSRKGRRAFSFSFARKLARELRRGNYQAAVDLRGDARHIFLLWLAGIPVRIGYGTTGLGFLLTHEAAYRPGAHELDHAFDLLKVLGVEPLRAEEACPLRCTEGSSVEEELGRLGVNGKRPIVCLLPGAGEERKRWNSDRFVQVGRELQELWNANLVVLGDASERMLAQELSRRFEDGVLNLAGRTTLGTLSALLRRADLVIGNDSGPAHLAAALGTPAIVLYTEDHTPAQWRPWGRSAVCLWKPEGLSAIEVSEVVGEASKILGKARR